MVEIQLTAENREQERIRQYLEEYASETLAEKINGGVVIEQDGKQLRNRKTLSGFMTWACEEAKKQAAKGANAACIDDATVFGWAIHYFEEDSIVGTLYTEDGAEYKPAKPKKTSTPITNTPKAKVPVTQNSSGQQSFFDALDIPTESTNKKEDESKDDADDCGITDDEPFVAVKSKKEEPKTSPLYERYMAVQNKHSDSIVAMRVGDFYEVFGENAKILSCELDLILTGRDCGLSERVPMIGFPYHKADTYFSKIRCNHRLLVSENETEKILEQYVPVSDALVDSYTGEVVRQEEAEPDLMALIARSFDEAYISDLYERLEYHIDIC